MIYLLFILFKTIKCFGRNFSKNWWRLEWRWNF